MSETVSRRAAGKIRSEAMMHQPGPALEAENPKAVYVRDPDGVRLELFETMGAPARIDARRY